MISGTDNRFRNLEKKVGFFVLIAMIAVMVVILLVVIENDLFSSTFTVRLTAPKGTGFSNGMPVKLSGFRIGRVKSTTLNDSAAVDVVLQIDVKYMKWIRKDSTARLVKEGIIGDYIIEISSGTSTELIVENGQIELVKSKAFDELAEEIVDKVKPVLIEIKEIIAYVNNEKGDVKKTLRNLNTFTANIEKSRKNADILMGTGTNYVEKSGKRFDILLTRVESRIDQTQPVIMKLDNTLQTFEKRLPEILEKVDATLLNLETMSAQLKGTTTENLPHIPRIIEKTEGVLDQSEGILGGVRKVWPLRNFMSPIENKSLIRRDSSE